MVTVEHEQTWIYRCPYCGEPEYLKNPVVSLASIVVVCKDCGEKYKAQPPKESIIK